MTDYDNIFAAGDVIDWKEQKQSAKSSAHGVLAAANILAFLNKGSLKPYKGATEMIVITNGKVSCSTSPLNSFPNFLQKELWFGIR